MKIYITDPIPYSVPVVTHKVLDSLAVVLAYQIARNSTRSSTIVLTLATLVASASTMVYVYTTSYTHDLATPNGDVWYELNKVQHGRSGATQSMISFIFPSYTRSNQDQYQYKRTSNNQRFSVDRDAATSMARCATFEQLHTCTGTALTVLRDCSCDYINSICKIFASP